VKYGEAAFASHSTAKTWPEIRCKYFKTDQDYTRLRGFGFPARHRQHGEVITSGDAFPLRARGGVPRGRIPRLLVPRALS